MFIVLFTLLAISLLGISIILVRHRKHRHRKLLHYLKKSCNIDSIEFEKKLKHTSKVALKLLDVSKKSSQKIIKNLQKGSRSIVEASKKKIRNKLFDTEQNGVVSEFITKLKDNSKK